VRKSSRSFSEWSQRGRCCLRDWGGGPFDQFGCTHGWGTSAGPRPAATCLTPLRLMRLDKYVVAVLDSGWFFIILNFLRHRCGGQNYLPLVHFPSAFSQDKGVVGLLTDPLHFRRGGFGHSSPPPPPASVYIPHEVFSPRSVPCFVVLLS